jgi:hypothetical protein
MHANGHLLIGHKGTQRESKAKTTAVGDVTSSLAAHLMCQRRPSIP